MNNKRKISLHDDLWVILLDIIAVNLACFGSLAIRGKISFGTDYGASFSVFFGILYKFAPVYTVLCLLVFFVFGLYGGFWRYAGMKDMNRIIGASIVSFTFHILGTLFLLRGKSFNHMPLAYYAGVVILQFTFICLIRFGYLLFVKKKHLTISKPGKALVIGTGELGQQEIRTLGDGDDFNLCCVVAPDNTADGNLINGIPVYRYNRLEELLDEYSITCVFLADLALKDEVREDVKTLCDKHSVEFIDCTAAFSGTLR